MEECFADKPKVYYFIRRARVHIVKRKTGDSCPRELGRWTPSMPGGWPPTFPSRQLQASSPIHDDDSPAEGGYRPFP
jgi:hypothetical protein